MTNIRKFFGQPVRNVKSLPDKLSAPKLNSGLDLEKPFFFIFRAKFEIGLILRGLEKSDNIKQ